MLPNDLIILGGGSSVTEGIEKGLFQKFPELFTCGLNYSFKYVPTTVNLGIDEQFYMDNRPAIDKLPLFIGKEHYEIKFAGKNAWFLRPNKTYRRDLLHGIYTSTLAGLFSLSLLIPDFSVFLHNRGVISSIPISTLFSINHSNRSGFFNGEIAI